MDNITAELFLKINNAFNPHPTEGWKFTLQCNSRYHPEEDEHLFPASFPASVMAGHNDELVRTFQKRLNQKFDARFSCSDTYYPGVATSDNLF